MALDSLDTLAKAALLKAPKSERGDRIKKLKKEIRESKSPELLPAQLKESISVGLKQCLKEIEAENLRLVIFDSSVNLPAVRCLIDKGKLPFTGVPNLGAILKQVIGFPGITIGFKKNSNPHFEPFLTLIESGLTKVVARTEIETKSKDQPTNETSEPVKKVESKIQVLVRKDKSKRVFKPNAPTAPKEVVKNEKTDFIGFSSTPSNGVSTEKKKISYLSTVMKMV